MSRCEVLRAVDARHPGFAELRDVIEAAFADPSSIPTHAAVVQATDGDWCVGLHDLQGALAFLTVDYPDWEPHALYELDTGRSLPIHVTVAATVSADPGATCEPDISRDGECPDCGGELVHDDPGHEGQGGCVIGCATPGCEWIPPDFRDGPVRTWDGEPAFYIEAPDGR